MKAHSLKIFAVATALVFLSSAAIPADFTYDAAGRLVAADYGAGKSISYAYDNAGNLLQLSQPSPGIAISVSGNQVTLSWPAAPGSFILESSPVLGAGAVWSDTGLVPALNGDRLTVTVTVVGTTKFYRLHKS